MLLLISVYALLVALICAAWNDQDRNIGYSTVTAYFVQDDNSTNATSFDFRTTNFGLINRTYDDYSDGGGKKTQWQLFAKEVSKLQHRAQNHVHYKVLFLGRHGEGFHNAAEAFYGTPAWNCYYSILNGNDTVTWADAELTPTGINQALANNKFWASEIETQKIPNPNSFYTSPLTRCLATANLTFSGLKLKHPFIPTVKELLREGISGHTCDRRGSKSYIHANFPTYEFEEGFAETDQLWEALHGETSVDQTIRSKTILDDIFTHDKSTYISITSHSGEIASILGGQYLCPMLEVH
ncbi:uncharacterized protein KY384_009106 [Bacidia gigantensis]|uniref:uncharacterized protein n=1 Tax=Bacidia gigantensis TaxID=2732470 RepID=UPI001D0482B0|nr:uncharacterized protein KY384_009106 [Bacidia gigantensis]KAG8525462.1 hypothetical protein KY384_009106 [Bacidia gigantensis]